MMPRRWSRRHIHRIRAVFGFVLSFFLTPALLGAPKPISKGVSEGQAYVVELLTQPGGLLWSFDFLPDGRVILSERSGKLMIFDPKTEQTTPVAGAPQVWEKGQGGLLEVRVHPRFDETKWIYLTYSEPVGAAAATALGRGKLEGTKLVGFEKLFRAEKPTSEAIHFGSRLEFDGKGTLYMTSGERNVRKWVQQLDNHVGKVLRLDEDGKAKADNPFTKQAGAKPEIYSYGHRNQQGLAYDPKTGDLWEAEMGPRGGDELNLIKAGANYGWPVVTYGREYWGPKIGEGERKEGMTEPTAYWVPSISPSGLAIYRGSAFPKWDGHAFLACLSGQQLRRVALANGKAGRQEEMLKDLGARFRAVRVGPEGFLYLSTDDGKLIRLRPETKK